MNSRRTRRARTRPAGSPGTALLAAAAAVAAAASLAACGSHGRDRTALPGDGSPGAASPAAPGGSAGAAPAAAGDAPTLYPKSGAPLAAGRAAKGGADGGAGGGRCSSYPNPDCTGMPAGIRLAAARNDGPDLKVTKAGTVLDHVHVTGDILVAVDGVTIRDSQIDGAVRNEVGGRYHRFTIIDSTVGPAHGCQSNDGVGRGSFTATGVHVRGHSHGFMDSGDDIVIRDSYVRNCSNGNDHADGVQAYKPGRNLVIDHSTFDQRGIADFTAPLYLSDSAGNTIRNVTVTDNLVMGGTYSIQLKNAAGTLIVKNNRMVDKTWSYGPVESQCSVIDWSGNTLVTIDANYRVTSTVGPLPCRS